MVGAVPEIDPFASALAERYDAVLETRFEQGVYALHTVIPARKTRGSMRPAEHADRALVLEWVEAFSTEVLHESVPGDSGRLERSVDARLAGGDAGFALWEANGRPVSLVGFGGPTPNGIRIGPVYTPPEHRGHGYGSALTAGVSAQQLAQWAAILLPLHRSREPDLERDLRADRVRARLRLAGAGARPPRPRLTRSGRRDKLAPWAISSDTPSSRSSSARASVPASASSSLPSRSTRRWCGPSRRQPGAPGPATSTATTSTTTCGVSMRSTRPTSCSTGRPTGSWRRRARARTRRSSTSWATPTRTCSTTSTPFAPREPSRSGSGRRTAT